MKKFDLTNFYSEDLIKEYADKLNKERLEWLNSFENLNHAIVDTIEP